MICERCGKEFHKDWRIDKKTKKTPCRFCSRNCCNSRPKTKETKEKISNSLKKREIRFCSKCGKKISFNNKSGICFDCCLSNRNSKKTRVELQEIQNKKRREFKKKLVEYKGGECEICGYSNCLGALEFHHIDPNKKEYDLSRYRKQTLENILEEISKCSLLCCRCHREIHEHSHIPL